MGGFTCGAVNMRIITNADDLGANPATNEAIFTLMAEGLVTSSTILANGPAVAAACCEAVRFGGCSFGVHLNLTEFKPLTRDSGLQSLVNETGDFNASVRQVRRLLRLRAALLAELSAQVERVAGLGVRISHFDSHHHVHTIPGLLPVIKTLQRRFHVYRVRISRNHYRPAERPGLLLLLKKWLFNAALRRWPATRTTAVFTDLDAFREQSAAVTLARTVEIMLHPGGPGGESEAADLRCEASRDDSFRSRLISYHEL